MAKLSGARLISQLAKREADLEASILALAPGRHGFGDGLWLEVTTRRSWSFRYMVKGRARQMGLGPWPAVPLGRAREMVTEARRSIVDHGVDPIDQRRQRKAAQAAEEARHVTFSAAARQYIDAHRQGWRNVKHAVQWERTIVTYVNPVIGLLPVSEITTADVRRVLTPIWAKKPETASRVRGRIEAVLGAQIALGNAAEPNVARWHNNLQAMLPPRSRMAPVKHHAALDWEEVPAFIDTLRSQAGMGAWALEFLIFTAARSGEVRLATWDEIDLKAAAWEISGERMKAGKPHRVPLSRGALDVLARAAAVRRGGLVFPGTREGQPLSDMTLTLLLRRMGRPVTAHGMRATFKTWASDKTAHPIEVIESSLAHAVGGRVEQAYQRGTWFERRRELMNEWSEFCWPQPKASNVVAFQAATSAA